jgi:hypothetical protein
MGGGWQWGSYLQECVVARKDQRWDAGVGASGGKLRSNARVWRSLDVDQPTDVEPVERGKHDNRGDEDCHDGRSGKIWRRGVPEDQRPP